MDFAQIFEQVMTPEALGVVTAISVLLALVSIVMTPWALLRIPANYFQTPRPHLLERLKGSNARHATYLVAKNTLGVFLFIAGVLMLVLPGQGLLTLLISLILMDFPKKAKVERTLLQKTKVITLVNRLRRHYGRPELLVAREDTPVVPTGEQEGSNRQ